MKNIFAYLSKFPYDDSLSRGTDWPESVSYVSK